MANTETDKLKCPLCGSTYVINNALEAALNAGNAIYYRPHKHRNWKHEKYEVVCGDTIVNTLETENSAKILVNALRNYFAAHTQPKQQQPAAGVPVDELTEVLRDFGNKIAELHKDFQSTDKRKAGGNWKLFNGRCEVVERETAQKILQLPQPPDRSGWLSRESVETVVVEAFKASTYLNVDGDAKYWSKSGDYNKTATHKFFPQEFLDEKLLPSLRQKLSLSGSQEKEDDDGLQPDS